MKRTPPALFAAVLALTLAVSARAQGMADGMGSPRLVSFGLGGGLSVPVSDAKDALKNGFAGHGWVRLNLRALPIAPRVDFTFSRFDLKDAQLASPGLGNPSGTSTMLAGLASVQYFLMPGAVRPYLIAGLGAYDLSTDVEANGTSATSSSTHFGVNAGAGLSVRFGKLVSGYVEGRVDNVYSDRGAIDTKQIQVVPVTFGLVF